MNTVAKLIPWAYHGIFDCANCDIAPIQSESTIRSCLVELAPIVANATVGEAYMAITGVGQSDKEGFAAAQLTDLGTITVKFVNSSASAYFDIVSCKEYTGTDVETTLKKYFGANLIINKILIPRNANAIPPAIPGE